MNKLIGVMVLLGPCVLMDIKSRRVPVYYILTCAMCAVLLNLIFGWEGGLEMVLGLIIGGVFLLISYLSKEMIGYGDGILIAAMGLWCGGTDLLGIILLSMIFTGIFGLILIMARKGRKKMRLPFTPFLAAGGVLSCVITIGGIAL